MLMMSLSLILDFIVIKMIVVKEDNIIGRLHLYMK